MYSKRHWRRIFTKNKNYCASEPIKKNSVNNICAEENYILESECNEETIQI